MSGPKAADVQLKLDRAIESIRRQIGEAESNNARYQQLGVSETRTSRAAAAQALASAAGSPDARQFASEELRQLASLRGQIEAGLAEGDRLMSAADQLRRQAEELRARSESQLQQAVTICQAVGQAVNEATASKHVRGFYQEDRRALEARQLADEALQQERETARLLWSAADYGRQARNIFDAVASQGRRQQAEAERIEQLAGERKQAATIAEEGRRNATSARQEADALSRRIEALDHEKFAAGRYAPMRDRVGRLRTAFDRSDYRQVNELADDCLGPLRNLADKVAQLQAEWEAAQKGAANDLEAADQELSGIDREFITQWSGDAIAVRVAYDGLTTAREAFGREDFRGAQEETGRAVQALRELNDRAAQNKARFDQRETIAEAIMNALYEQGYDAPAFHFSEKDAAGTENRLSDLRIFAQHPGRSGDMRMNIHLDGHVDLEVEGIGEGEESHCVNLVQELQESLAGEVDFQMTDWGRAAGAQEKTVAVVVQEQVQDKVKERHRG